MPCCLLLFSTASAPRMNNFSRLDTLPICTPVNASPTPSRMPAHDSEPSRLTRPCGEGGDTVDQLSADFGCRRREPQSRIGASRHCRISCVANQPGARVLVDLSSGIVNLGTDRMSLCV